MVGRGRRPTRCTSRRCTASRTARCDVRRLAALGRARPPPRGARRAPAGRRDRPGRRHRHRLVGDRLRPARRGRASCSATRSPTATAATDGVAAQVLQQGRRARAVRPDRRAAAAVQHDLPAGRRGRDARARGGGRRMLLLPDLLGYWLTGEVGAERTNASTTGLYDVRSREWATDLADRVGIPSGILPPLRSAGRPGRAAAAGRGRRRSACPPTSRSSRSARTTPPPRWWPCPPATSPRRTSPRAPGRWSASSSTSRC